MEGFLPLIEGFVAFALTMLALTTAVSAIVGAGHRLRRRRARGLRDMVRLLYLREVRPLLVAANGGMAEPAESRADFICDMTLMPVPKVVKGLEIRGEDYWRKKLQSAERLVGESRFAKYLHPKRWARKWRTLRYGLDALSEQEFTQRLAESAAGKKIRDWQPEMWRAREEHLVKSFQAIGSAATEVFARHSRSWSVLVGFLLAFGVNIDSFDLLNSYLTNPELRAGVLERSEAIRAQEAPAGLDESAIVSSLRQRLDATTEKAVQGASDAVSQTIETRLTSALGDQGSEVANSLKAEVEKAVRAAAGELEGVVEDGVGEAEREVSGVVRSLSASFPVGWTRFPNCFYANSPDMRCVGETAAFNRAKARLAGKPMWQRAVETIAARLPGWLTSPLAAATSRAGDWRVMVGSARLAAPTEFYQWLVGVLLTGCLLGLGTPFWIQVINKAMSLQRWATKQGDGAPMVEGPAAVQVVTPPPAQATPASPTPAVPPSPAPASDAGSSASPAAGTGAAPPPQPASPTAPPPRPKDGGTA